MFFYLFFSEEIFKMQSNTHAFFFFVFVTVEVVFMCHCKKLL